MSKLQAIKSAIETQIKEYSKQVEVWHMLLNVLQKFEGKQVSKRIETAIKKENDAFVVYMDNSLNFYKLQIWGNGIVYEQRLSFVLSYDDTFSLERFIDNNISYTLAEQRKQELEAYLSEKLEEIEYLIEYQSNLQAKIKEFKKLIPKEYPINRFFNLEV